jgi:hypothetical protein
MVADESKARKLTASEAEVQNAVLWERKRMGGKKFVFQNRTNRSQLRPVRQIAIARK